LHAIRMNIFLTKDYILFQWRRVVKNESPATLCEISFGDNVLETFFES
jgi:hypothetical protein